jgi:hypothetical protein
MSGYVEAGYAVVGVTLSAYAAWIVLRRRSVEEAVDPGQRERSGEPRPWR